MHILNFRPLFGLSSPHLQTTLPLYLNPGTAPSSTSWLVALDDGDSLSCEISTPPEWKRSDKIILLVHGLGGNHSSVYMIRLARKLFSQGHKVVRVNLRGAGSGKGLSKKPYCGGSSHDLLKVVHAVHQEFSCPNLFLIGFSLGGNIALKMAGELAEEAPKLLKRIISICAPLDLADTMRILICKRNRLYHNSYLKSMLKQTQETVKQKIGSMYAFDQHVTAPLWGFKSAEDYYLHCSSIRFLPKIQVNTHLLFAKDDPFVNLNLLGGISLPPLVHVWATEKGGHMGFIGKTEQHQFFWMDQLLTNWMNEDFTSDLSKDYGKITV